ncbi:MAG: (2Fe-2S)-binding protein [Candidatus Tectomicrobia bacterium]|nr:(2Fe-2S)-binding protein [Candidatus Tectomicrobia bacterium]
MSARPLKLSVNGKTRELAVPDHRLLLDLLRNDLGLVATRETCGLGACGACTVLLDGAPIASCITLARYAEGKEVTTLEGIAPDDGLHPVQKSFLEHNAFQCAFCTPGMVMMACALLKENPRPSEAEIRDYMAGNICRCTTYHEIIRAIHEAHRFA